MTDETTGRASASYGSASHAAIIIGKHSRKADAVLAPNQNIENNPMQSSMCRWHGCFTRENILTRHRLATQHGRVGSRVRPLSRI
jgi:hypothetical protein